MSHKKHLIEYVPEPPDVAMTFVGWSAVGTLLLLAISIAGLFGIYRAAVPKVPAPSVQKFPGPQVDTRERAELRRLREVQNRELESWRWSDNQHSQVQIPIERAMQLLVSKGVHAYDPLLSAPSALTSPTAAAERSTIHGGSGDATSSQPGSNK
jgi:hypothetical protein